MQSSVNYNPVTSWEFNRDVTSCFEDMLRRSIPQYDVMRSSVKDIAIRYARKSRSIVDLGCSRGDTIAQIVEAIGSKDYQYIGVDTSDSMLEISRQRFKGTPISIQKIDLRHDYPQTDNACITLSVLTLQFVPIEYRQKIVKQVFESTIPGGVFILVEKILGATADINATMVDLYYQLKGENGYSEETIERKRLSLEGVLVPVTSQWNEDILKSAGFSQVDCFWRWMNFAGWIAIK